MATWNLGEVLATTLPGYEQEFKDQVFSKRVLLDFYKNNGGVVTKGGGTTFRMPLMTGKANAEWFAGADSLNVNTVDTLDAAEYTWRNLNTAIIFTLDDELANSGKEQVIDLIEAKVRQAELTIADQLNSSLFAGTGNEARPRIVGLSTAVGTGTFGGIAGGTYTDWQSYVNALNGALTIASMKTARNTVNNGAGGAPCGLIVGTQTLFEKYEALLTPTYYMNPATYSKEAKRIGDVGFPTLEFAGIPFVFDDACTSTYLYFLNAVNSKVLVHKDAYMDKTERMKPIDQHITAQHIVLRCLLGVNRRKSLGVITGATA